MIAMAFGFLGIAFLLAIFDVLIESHRYLNGDPGFKEWERKQLIKHLKRMNGK